MIATILRWLGFEPQWKRAFNLTAEQRHARSLKSAATRARNRSMSKGGGNG